ncbi:unnamed protein product [Paramecium sonneborni]|uniref:Uncharacterized protein n=1 Tax=Paramecium sonneborni TaxID=65129 RepID=A0A8S1NVQ5_9CILI|nr:unnamed protein product [Paramecium sonneborni]
MINRKIQEIQNFLDMNMGLIIYKYAYFPSIVMDCLLLDKNQQENPHRILDQVKWKFIFDEILQKLLALFICQAGLSQIFNSEGFIFFNQIAFLLQILKIDQCSKHIPSYVGQFFLFKFKVPYFLIDFDFETFRLCSIHDQALQAYQEPQDYLGVFY